MKSLFLTKVIVLFVVLSLAATVSAGRLNNQDTRHQDKQYDLHIERSSVYHFAGSGELTTALPLAADCLDCPDGCVLTGAGTTSEMFVTGPLLTLAPPNWASEVNIVWEDSVSTIAGGLCAPVNGTITDTFPDGSTLTAKVVGLACAPASSEEGVPLLPYVCYLSAKVVEGTGQCEGAKGIAKITSYIDVDGKITMLGEGTLKLEKKVEEGVEEGAEEGAEEGVEE